MVGGVCKGGNGGRGGYGVYGGRGIGANKELIQPLIFC